DDGLHAREHLYAALGLRRLARLRLEACDEGLDPAALVVLPLLEMKELAQALASHVLEGIVRARVEGELAPIQMQDGADDAVEQVPVVADDEHCVRIGGEIALEPHRAFEIEIVRRLV